jgi:hypothetical protein
MITSLDEAKLLLNKWISSSTLVVAVLAIAFPDRLPPNATGVTLRLSGRITGMDETGTFMLVPSSATSSDDFLLVAIPGCGFGFSGSIPIPPIFNNPLNLFPDKWESTLYIVFPNTDALILFAPE